jgi:hypothetical protein
MPSRFAIRRWRTFVILAFVAGCGVEQTSPEVEPPEESIPTESSSDFLSQQKTSIPGASRFDLYFTQPGTSAVTGSDPILDDDLAALIGSATASIDAAFFDFDRQNVISALIAAQTRGVTVRLVGDGDNLGEAGYVQATAAGIPMVNRPAGSAIMHDKFVVVDGRFVWLGSANGSDNDVLRNNNNALILESPDLAAAYKAEFAEMFVNQRFGPAKGDVTSRNDVIINGTQVEYYFGPRDALMNQLFAKLDTADTSVRFMIFTFSRADLKDRLVAKQNAGVKVYGVFDQLQAGQSFSQDDALSLAGVPTWIDGNNNIGGNGGGLLHHKVMVIDGETNSDPLVITGSFNWTDAADNANDENLVVIHSGVIARAFLEEWCAIAAVATKHPSYAGAADTACGGNVLINEALPNPAGTDVGQEYVELVNTGIGALNLGGWTLNVGTTVRHRFPANFTLPGVGVTVVYDSGSHASIPGAVLSSTSNLSLTNSGATITLKNAAGATIDTFTYGASADGVAKNRNPDLKLGAPVADHSQVAGASGLTSPGRRADQTSFASVGVVTGPVIPPPAGKELIITQFATRGPSSASDEFVELYNNTDHILDVSSVHLQYAPASCSGWSDRHVVPNGTRLAPGQFYLLASSSYVAPVSGLAPDGALGGSGLADNGQLRLVDAVGTEVDRVAYGSGLSCTGEGGTVAPNHGTTANGDSVLRRPGSYTNANPARDTDNNANDFALKVGRTARNASSPPEVSKGIVRPVAGELLITQFATRGFSSASDEFVELYNNSAKTLTIDGVKIQYQTTSCGSWSDRHTIPIGTTLAPGKFYLTVNASGYLAPASGPPADGNLSSSGLSDNGSLRLFSGTSEVLDLVAYGTGLACTGEGGTIAPNHGTAPNGNSVARKPADTGAAFSPSAPARDTGSNASDFGVKTGRLPRGSSMPAQPSRS